jgi:acyl-coenzyme A synthetase/AMP-(fatty) acid ligase
MLDALLATLEDAGDSPALIMSDVEVSYGKLHDDIEMIEDTLKARGVQRSVVCIVGDYSPKAIATLIALWRLGNVVALITGRPKAQEDSLIRLSESRYCIHFSNEGEPQILETGQVSSSEMLLNLNQAGEAGFIIFSSGSTGDPKASVHRAAPLLEKNSIAKRQLRSISFLLFDHIGGLNTLFYILFNRGTLVVPEARQPEAIARAIEKHGVQSITTSPTFLNLMLASGVIHRYDFSSLQVVNYGTEPMALSTLDALNAVLPHVRFSQAYGLTETGVIPTRSKTSDSNWVKLGGPGCEIRVVNGLLEIKTTTSMVGYLGQDSPFTEDGYFKTGDSVVQDGEYFRIIGRQSDIINVGGEKVYPAEVENVLRTLDGVVEVVVSKAEHPIVGNFVVARFQLRSEEDVDSFRTRLYVFCAGKLRPAQIPRKITLTTDGLHGERFKKIRR